MSTRCAPELFLPNAQMTLLSDRSPLFVASLAREDDVKTVHYPRVVKAEHAESVESATRVVDGEPRVEMCSSDLGNPFQEIAIFPED